MNKYKVAVYAICKNEEKFVDRWMDSMSEADGIYVADTGSDDDTVKRLMERGASVRVINVTPWRFDTARNISLSLVPEDTDICVCTDLDEVFLPGWRALLESAWTPETTRLKYMYTWSFNADGTPGVTFRYEKIHARHGFKWIHPVHEVLEYSGEKPDVYAVEDRICLHHHPDPEKSRAQYLPLLEQSVREAPDDDRNMHYLGREYMFYGKWDECIAALKRHLSMPSAVWRDERAASMRYISRAYAAKGDYAVSEEWIYRAIAEAPYAREPYAEAAKLFYTEGKWEGVVFMVREALKISPEPSGYISEAFCRDHTLPDLGAIACCNLGLYAESLKFAEEAVRITPGDERLKNNLEIIRAKNKA